MSTPLGYFLRNSSWVVSGQIINMVAGMLLSVVFARRVDPDVYGKYQYILAVIAFFSVFSLNGLNLSIMKSVIAGSEGSLKRATRTSFFAGLLAIPFLLVFAWYTSTYRDSSVGNLLFFAALFFPFVYACNGWSSFYEAKKKYQSVVQRMIPLQLTITGAIGVAAWFRMPLPVLVGVFLGLTAIGHFIYYREAASRAAPGGSELDVRYGILITIQKFSQTLTGTLPPILIAIFFQYEQVAIFAIAFSLVALVSSIATTMLSIYQPYFFDVGRINISFSKVLGGTIGLGLVLTLAFATGLSLFFFPLYGAAYEESYNIAWFVLPCIIFFPLRAFLGYYLTAKGNNVSLTLLNVLSHVLGALLLVIGHRSIAFVPLIGWYYITITLASLPFNIFQFLRVQRRL